MKLKLALIIFLSFVVCTVWGQQNEVILQSVVQDIYNKAKRYSLYRKSVDWDILHEKIFSTSINTRADLEKKVGLIFEALGDKHAMLLFNGKRIVYAKPPGLLY